MNLLANKNIISSKSSKENAEISAKYEDLLNKIYQRFPSVQKTDFSQAYKPGLERTIKILEYLENPQKKYRKIHIAGTNGKGSVSSMLTSVLSQKMSVGLFTSPHILDFRERMRIIRHNDEKLGSGSSRFLGQGNGVEYISKEDVVEFLEKYSTIFEKLDLSFFEITTAMAFNWFAKKGVDVAVIETGMGGRLDSTNVIIPDLSIITNIGLDHCQYLGSSLAEVAAEKAGIFKQGVPALVGEPRDETKPVFERIAQEKCNSLYYAPEILPDEKWRGSEEYNNLSNMDLQGPYQSKNVRTALAALEILSTNQFYSAVLSEVLNFKEQVVNALTHTAQRTEFHGRWERLQDNPIIICDIGHNAPALEYNFFRIRSMISCGEISEIAIIYGVMKDKDLSAILPLMNLPSNCVTWLFVTPSTKRALAAQAILKQYTKEYPHLTNAYAFDSVEGALEFLDCKRENKGLNWIDDTPGKMVYIGGSTFVVSDAMKVFQKNMHKSLED